MILRHEKTFDAVLTGICIEIGLTEAAHLMAVFLKWSLTKTSIVWAIVTFVFWIVLIALLLVRWYPDRQGKAKNKTHEKEKIRKRLTSEPYSTLQQGLVVAFFFSVLLQMIFIWTEQGLALLGDMTIETVQSFLVSDGIYTLNPLTGQPYQMGLPFRLEILCLPTLYAVLCKLFAITPELLVWRIIPVVVLAVSYLAYYQLAWLLFQKDRTKRCLFLLMVSAILWFGDYMAEMDGFQLLHCGYRGTAIRAGILIPCTIYMCLKKKWVSAMLCILAEACIVWTFYGLGACLLVTAVLFLLPVLERTIRGRRKANG